MPPTPAPRHVVTAVVTAADGSVALVKRSPRVGSFRGHWGGLSGFLEQEDTSTAARAATEAAEEAGFTALRHTVAGRPFRVDGDDRSFIVHPHAFSLVGKPAFTLNWENEEGAWVAPAAVGTAPYAPTVPRLAETLARVAPSRALADAAAGIVADRERGAAQLAVVALEALRDEAGRQASEAAVGGDASSALDAAADAAYALATTRPAMWALASALAGALEAARASAPADAPAAWRAVAESASAALTAATADAAALTQRGVAAVEAAIAAAPPGGRVVTNSYSSAVVAVLARAAAAAVARGTSLPVLVCESRPLNEGLRLARALADAGADVQLATDAAGAALTARPGFAAAVVVGADAVTPTAVVNKVGTAALARAAAGLPVPCLSIAGHIKLGGGSLEAVALDRPPPPPTEDAGAAELVAAYGATADLDRIAIVNPYFEDTPLALFDGQGSGVVTEADVLTAARVAEAATAARARVAAAFGLDWVGK